ncbi:hypothetical protein MMC13_002745 [Lambiella insularis]|nr:hypothetical protein [Lambiella insularis]
MNRSMPSLQRTQSPFARPPSRSSKGLPLPRLPAALRPNLDQGVRPFHHERQDEAYGGSHLQPPSPTPQYYDYSEAFQADYHTLELNMSVSLLEEQTASEIVIKDMAHELTRVTSTSDSARPPTEVSSPEHLPNVPICVVESPSPVVAPRKIRQQMTQWEKQESGTIYQQKEEQTLKSDDEGTEERVTLASSKTSAESTIGHHILSSSKPEMLQRFTRDSRCISTSASLALSMPRHSALAETSARLQPVDNKQTNEDGLRSTVTPMVQSSTLKPWQIPTLLFSPLALRARAQSLSSTSLPSDIDSPGKENIVALPIIQAPVPERSMSSRTNKDRFSRILSIDDGLADLARAVIEADLKPSPTTHASPVDKQDSDGLTKYQESIARHSTSRNLLAHTVSLKTEAQSHLSRSEVTTKCLPRVDNDLLPKKLLGIPSTEKLTDSKKGIGITSKHSKLPITTRTSSLASSSMERDSQPSSVLLQQQDCQLPSIDADITFEVTKDEPLQHPPVMPLLEAASIVPWEYDELITGPAVSISRFKFRSKSQRVSSALAPSSRDTDCCPWADAIHNPGLAISRPSYESLGANVKTPRFKLKVTRASSSTNGTVKITKPNSPTSSPRPSFGLPTDLFRAGPFGRKNRAESSSSAFEPFPSHAHVKEQIERIAMPVSQNNVRPLSPSHQLTEVRSFFSDDSSNIEQRGSLRQRISQFRAIASRGNSVDVARATDRRQTSSALGRSSVNKRNSGRHSRHNSTHSQGTTDGVSAAKYAQWKIGEKFRTWWYKGEEKLKGWTGRMKKSNRKRRPRSTEMYAGV